MVGFPRLYYYIKDDTVNTMVMTLLDQNLDTLMKRHRNGFSLKTTLMIADQMILRLKSLHSLGYIHRDLKPHNIMIGFGENNSIIHLIDFGICK